jgi:AcrR family transcriptional regulator
MAAGRDSSRSGVGSVRPPREGAHVVEMQRRRLLTAIVELVYERRTGGLTVATVCDRARVSRKTFYDLFDDCEECLLAAFQDGVAHAREAVIEAVVSGQQSHGAQGAGGAGGAGEVGSARGVLGWRERVRVGLGALLAFFDREPGIARLLVVDALGSGERTLRARQRALAGLIAVVEEGRSEARTTRQPPPLTAEGIVGGVFAVIHARMLSIPSPADARSRVNGAQAPHAPRLVELTGALMAMVLRPYLGPAVAQKEIERLTPSQPAVEPRLPADPFKDLPIRVTYRTARVLATIAADPGVSNRKIGDRAGAQDQGQVSKLLARLQRNGLIENHGKGHPTGEPNAWTLTPRGQAIHTALGD